MIHFFSEWTTLSSQLKYMFSTKRTQGNCILNMHNTVNKVSFNFMCTWNAHDLHYWCLAGENSSLLWPESINESLCSHRTNIEAAFVSVHPFVLSTIKQSPLDGYCWFIIGSNYFVRSVFVWASLFFCFCRSLLDVDTFSRSAPGKSWSWWLLLAVRLDTSSLRIVLNCTLS